MATRLQSNRLTTLVYVTALLTTIPVLWRVVLPALDGSRWPKHVDHLLMILVHAWGGLAMLGCGAAALYIGWTRRKFRFHRMFGYTYLSLGGISAVAALGLSYNAAHEPKSLYVATATLSATWLAFAAMALRAALNRRFDSHRQWVIRSYVLTWTFVGCRLATQVDFYPWLGTESVTAAVWINWIGPLILCEIALQWSAGAKARQSS